MKCIYCGTDSNMRAREAGRCRGCGRPFAFEPKRDRGMTDLTFKLAIEAVSDGGRLVWTDDHLYYDVCRRVRRRRLLHRLLRRSLVSLDRSSFRLLLDRWIARHGPPDGRLERRAFEGHDPDAVTLVDAFDFEHLVICDDDATADVLIVNGFHTELKCPVLSYRGYPSHVYDALISRLREQPPAKLVVVHDADPNGCGMARAIAEDPRWFAGVELPKVIDAGLRPGDAPHFRGLYEPAASGFDTGLPGISLEEAKWLGRYRLDLAAARPRVLMGALGRVLRDETESRGTDAAPFWLFDDMWVGGDDDVG